MNLQRSVYCLFLFLASGLIASAQIGDKAGEAQKPIVPEKLIPASPALSAQEELQTFKVAPGYRIELVAADPLVRNPVAMAFGPDGRLWVVEMTGYMPDLDGSTEDRAEGRVVVLSDTDGDGVMDKRVVFLENIVLPRAIALHRDGVLVGAPPHLWFCRDTNGDGGADEKVEVATDFGVRVDPALPQLANPERAPNSLLWGQDGWLHVGAYTAKFRYEEGKWVRGTSNFRGQWGLTQDDYGRLYSNNNSDLLRVDLVPSHYLFRNPFLGKTTGLNTKAAVDQFVWPIRVSPGINRGYRSEMLRDYRLKECTAACAPWIYRSDLFPADAYGNAFVCEPAGNLIHRLRLGSENGLVRGTAFYDQREFVASTDERFRPVNLATGPEGALYVVDFYHGVIQHRISLTTYLREQIVSRGLEKPLSLGRIWRIVPDVKAGGEAPAKLSALSTAQLVSVLGSGNDWRRETAQRLLVERAEPSSIAAVVAFGKKTNAAMGRVHALWTLHGLKATDWTLVEDCLEHADPRVRAAAVRVSEVLLETPHRVAVVERWKGMAEREATAEVQLQLVLSMGESRDLGVDLVTAALCKRGLENTLLQDAFLSGISGRELEVLTAVLKQPASYAPTLPGALLRCVFAERNPERIMKSLALVAAQPVRTIQVEMLAALAKHPTVNVKHPVLLPNAPEALVPLLADGDKALAGAVAAVQAALLWPGKPGVAVSKVAPLTNEQHALFDSGKQTYLGLCAACHQPTGRGQEGLAPPLLDSEWVSGSPERIARVVMHGLRGPVNVKGVQYKLDMPAAGFLSDEQIAGVLTYIRREWEHEASPVTVELVKGVRAATQGRTDAWSEPELLQIP